MATRRRAGARTKASSRDPAIFVPDPDLYPDPTGRADRICRFIGRLRLWEGEYAGQPFRLHDFQRAIIRRIYGPTTQEGRRQVRIAAIWIPRGNAKTTLASGLALAHFMGPEAEPGGQVIMGAADRDQASIAFNASLQMIKQDAELLKRVKPAESLKRLNHPGTNSTLKAISHEAYSKHGLNVSFFLADEIHAWPAGEARRVWAAVTDSMVKRREPLTIIISTAGEGTGGLAHDWWEYSWKVASGAIEDPTFAPIIFAAPPEAAKESKWKRREYWFAANPALEAGFLSLEELEAKAKRIEHFPAAVADFKRYHLNLWQEGVAEPWIDPAIYDAAAPPRAPEQLIGQPAWIGVDLSSVEDITAVVAVLPEGSGDNRAYDVDAKFFLPRENIGRKSDADQADYLRWAESGYLELTEGNIVDYDRVIDHILGLAERYGVREIAIDRWNSTSVSTRLQEAGLTVVAFGQGFRDMAAPVRELKRALLAKRFRHGGNPLLRMCFLNAVTDRDPAENEKFTKARSRGRIDGAVAAAMAIGRAMHFEPQKPLLINQLRAEDLLL